MVTTPTFIAEQTARSKDGVVLWIEIIFFSKLNMVFRKIIPIRFASRSCSLSGPQFSALSYLVDTNEIIKDAKNFIEK